MPNRQSQSRGTERQALRAIRLMILGSSDRASLHRNIDAMASYGLGDAELPAQLVGWLSAASEREERGDDPSFGDAP